MGEKACRHCFLMIRPNFRMFFYKSSTSLPSTSEFHSLGEREEANATAHCAWLRTSASAGQALRRDPSLCVVLPSTLHRALSRPLREPQIVKLPQGFSPKRRRKRRARWRGDVEGRRRKRGEGTHLGTVAGGENDT